MTNIEISILLWIQENLRGPMDGFWMCISSLADKGWFWITLGVVLLAFKKTRKVGITMLAALAINLCLTNVILKELIARVRPYNTSTEIVTLIKHLGDYSFPSGHTSASFSGALVLFRMMPKKVGIPAVILATMIGFSRLYVGVHFPTDVLGGIVVGMIASIAGYYLVSFVEKKIGEKINVR